MLKTNSKPYIQRPQDQRRAGVMAGRSGDYKTGAQAWADYYKYIFENFGRKTFLAGFKSGKSTKERVNPRGTGNTGITLPAHVRINPRTGKTQVFVTPKVAEKLRGVKGLRVAGNPRQRTFNWKVVEKTGDYERQVGLYPSKRAAQDAAANNNRYSGTKDYRVRKAG